MCQLPKRCSGCLHADEKHVDLRVLPLTADYFFKMPYKVPFFWFHQKGRVIFYIIPGDFFFKFHKLVFNGFFSYNDLYSENNYRFETLKGTWLSCPFLDYIDLLKMKSSVQRYSEIVKFKHWNTWVSLKLKWSFIAAQITANILGTIWCVIFLPSNLLK